MTFAEMTEKVAQIQKLDNELNDQAVIADRELSATEKALQDAGIEVWQSVGILRWERIHSGTWGFRIGRHDESSHWATANRTERIWAARMLPRLIDDIHKTLARIAQEAKEPL
jgi:hypothetical protein